jgi:glycosyltransferase involved in cell wall biosynthesis
MRVVHVSFSSAGGAGRVAGELVALQKERGVDSSLLAPISNSLLKQPLKHPVVTFNAAMDSFLTNSSRPTLFSYMRNSTNLLPEKLFKDLDILHLHWTPGVITLESVDRILKANSGIQVVWTMHDMFPFTGGCHHSFGCKGYQDTCSNCPQVVNSIRPKIQLALQRKTEVLRANPEIKFVAPSEWLASAARSSTNLRGSSVDVIPNPINSHFLNKSLSREESRGLFGFGRHEEIAVMIAEDLADPNKNIQTFVDELLGITRKSRMIRIVLVGANSKRIKGSEKILYKAGSLSSQELSRLVPAADYLIAPSEMETAPSIILEAAAVGVPSLVREANLGGVEMVEKFGFGLVSHQESDISELLSRLVSLRHNHSNRIRERALRLAGGEQVTKQYLDLYLR